MQSADDETVIVGLQVDPGLPARVARQLVSSLPGVLSRRVSDEVSWDVRVTGGPVPLNEQGTIPVPELNYAAVPGGRVDLTFCLTDLPRRVGTQPIIADASISPGVALISLPGVGGVRVVRRTQELIVYLAGQLAGHRVKDSDRSGQRRSWVRRWAAVLGAPVRRGTCPHTDMDVRLVTPGAYGPARTYVRTPEGPA